MPREALENPAEQAARDTREAIERAIDAGQHFLVEAGAGAGKTFSLIESLTYLIKRRGRDLVWRKQRVACITYTNVAVDEIRARTDCHPAVLASTIHAFLWSLIASFQPFLRERLPTLQQWREKVSDAGGVGERKVTYSELGQRSIAEDQISLHHDDVLELAAHAIAEQKFRVLLRSRYPIIFIDEYQDTDSKIVESLKTFVLDGDGGPQIGFFGDHWQKIYGSGCGRIDHPRIVRIGKRANFRSVPKIVECLNRIRTELQQQPKDPAAAGTVAVFHSNTWTGPRLTGSHKSGDLPPETASEYLHSLISRLEGEGWSFADGTSKILMLTHKGLAAQQGYGGIAEIFTYNDAFVKKEDPTIAFLIDVVEPACRAYSSRKYGEMLSLLGKSHRISSTAQKVIWAKQFNRLLEIQEHGTIGEVLDHIREFGIPAMPDAVEQRERAARVAELPEDEKAREFVERTRRLRGVAYREVPKLYDFINDNTPFSTKHGVKGAEFENVLAVFGRGWNQYNFNQFLESPHPPMPVTEMYERNRNLFYVACSRPQKRLVLLFTQKLSNGALATLERWFGTENVKPLVP